jgi:hypothetical protein
MPELNFNALMQPGPQGVFQGYMQGREAQNAFARQQQAQQLGDIQLQNALREQRLAGEEEAAYKAGAGNPQQILQELQQRGLGKQAMAMQAQMTKAQADKLAQQKTSLELVKNAAKQVLANPQNATQILQSFGQRTGVDMSDDLAEIQRLGDNVDAIRQWAAGHALEADKLLPKFDTMNLQGGVARQGYNPLTGAPINQMTITPVIPLPADVAAQKAQIARAGAANVTNVQEKAESGEFGKLLVNQYSDISKAAGLAAKTLPSIEANLSALNKGFDTGFGKETVAAGASVLAALGVKDAEKFATDTQKFQSNATQALLQKQLEQKGPQTESDARRIEQIGAQLGKTKDANEFILSMAKEQLKRDIDQSNFYRQWREKTGSFNGAESAWFAGEGSKSLFDRPALKKYIEPAAANAAPAATVRPSLNDIFKK